MTVYLSDYNTLELADAAAFSGDDVLVIDANKSVTADYVLTCKGVIFSGGIISPDDDVTVTFPNSVEAGPVQLFDVSSGGHCDLTSASTEYSFVEWWGVSGGDDSFQSGKASANADILVEVIEYATNRIAFFTPGIYSITGISLPGTRGLTIFGLGCSNRADGVQNAIVGSGLAWVDAANQKSVETHTANTHTSTSVTNIANMDGVAVGVSVTGSGVPANTVVASVNKNANSCTLSNATTTTLTGTMLTFTKNDPAMYLKYVIQNGVKGQGAEITLDGLQAFANNMLDTCGVGVLNNSTGDAEPWINLLGGRYDGYFGIHLALNYNNKYENVVFTGNGLATNTDVYVNGLNGAKITGGAAVAITVPNTNYTAENPSVVRVEFDHCTPQMSGNVSGWLIVQDQWDAAGGAAINAIVWTQCNIVGPAANGMLLSALLQTFVGPEFEQFSGTTLAEQPWGSSIWINPYGSTNFTDLLLGLSSYSVVQWRNGSYTGGSTTASLLLNASGVISPTQARAQAYFASTASNVTGDGTPATVVAPTVNYNVGSAYNNSTGLFTCPRDGYCEVSLNLSVLPDSGTSQVIAIVRKGAESWVIYNHEPSTTDVVNAQGSVKLPVGSGDQLYITLTANGTMKDVSIFGTSGAVYSWIEFEMLA
jgi:hypothetical protein